MTKKTEIISCKVLYKDHSYSVPYGVLHHRQAGDDGIPDQRHNMENISASYHMGIFYDHYDTASVPERFALDGSAEIQGKEIYPCRELFGI